MVHTANRKGEIMTQIEDVLKRLHEAKREHYTHIAGRCKQEHRVDVFVLACAWFTTGVLVGLVMAGIIEGITY